MHLHELGFARDPASVNSILPGKNINALACPVGWLPMRISPVMIFGDPSGCCRIPLATNKARLEYRDGEV
jgi:hypothetical protein